MATLQLPLQMEVCKLHASKAFVIPSLEIQSMMRLDNHKLHVSKAREIQSMMRLDNHHVLM